MEPETDPHLSPGQRTLAAIVFTDVVNFSGRMSIDEEHTLNLVQRDLASMSRVCEQFGGKVLKWTGDGLLLYFTSAVQAVACALKIQQQIAATAHESPPEEMLQHRIGIHLGDVFVSATDVMGDGVNIAARLQAEAAPGGICISQVVYDVVKKRIALKASYLGPRELKHIQEPIPLYQIILDAQPEPLKPITDLTNQVTAPPEVIRLVDQPPVVPQPQPEQVPPSSGLTLSPELQQQLEQLLFTVIGPIARLMIKQATLKSATVEELLANLMANLPQLSRTQFQQQVNQLRLIQALQESDSVGASKILHSPVVPSLPTSDRIEPEFLAQCEQELVKKIGPIAPRIIQRTLSQQPNLTKSQLIQVLVEQLPTPQKQAEFRQSIEGGQSKQSGIN
jgi:class 3 adenylate cyclase